MVSQRHRGEPPPDPPGHAPEWTAFLMMAAAFWSWLAFGAYPFARVAFLFGSGFASHDRMLWSAVGLTAALDMAFLFALGVVCVLVISSARAGSGSVLERVQGEPPSKSPGLAAEWTAFLMMGVGFLFWPALLVFMNDLGTVVFFLAFLFILGLVLALVIAGARSRHGRGMAPRGWVSLIVFLVSLIFVLARPYIGFGDTHDATLVVTILDGGSGEPVGGAAVATFDGQALLSKSVTNERGMAVLKFELWTWTYHSWLLSWRRFRPEAITIEARAPSYRNSVSEIENRPQYRIHLIHENLGYYPKPITMTAKLRLTRAPGPSPSGEERSGAELSGRRSPSLSQIEEP